MIYPRFIISIIRCIVTFGPIGSVPASGTVATVITALILYILHGVFAPSFFVIWTVPFIALCVVLVQVALPTFDQFDPPEIVLDEVAGFIFAMSFFPHTWGWLISGTLLFRFFDIVKPLGIKKIEQIGGACGILLDDVLAGFYTQIILIIGAMVYDTCFR